VVTQMKAAADDSDAKDSDKGSRRANPVDLHVGGRVRFRRMLIGMSQERLGECLGLTFQQIQKYEKGVNRIGASRLFELGKALGVSVGFFYEDAPTLNTINVPLGFGESPTESYSESYIVDFLGSREGLELNKAFARITDPKVRRSVVDLVRSLAGEETDESKATS
jgi:transcriptional regulator with XRE-family HTH domain